MSYFKHFLPMNLQPFYEADGSGGGTGTETPPAEDDAGKGTQDGAEEEAKKQAQAEAQKMADAIVAKKLKGMPSKEELAAFRAYQEAQKTPEQKESEELTKLKREAEEYKAKATAYENERAVIKAGIPAEFAEFVAYQVGKGVTDDTDFDAALKAFVKDNPQYKGQTAPLKTGLPHGSGGEQMDGVEKAFYERNPQLKE